MRHGVDDVVHAKLIRQRTHPNRIRAIASMFPTIAHVDVEVDDDHQIAAIVVDAPQTRRTLHLRHRSSVGTASQVPLTRNLRELVEQEKVVQQWIVLRNFNNRTVWKNAPHTGFKNTPIVLTVKIVDHQEPAAQLRIQVADEVNAAAVPAPAPATSHPDVSVAPGEVSVVSRDVPGPDAGASLETPGRCWRCDLELPDREGLRYCVFCGSDQLRPRCRQCDEQLEAEWRYCLACGSQRSAATD